MAKVIVCDDDPGIRELLEVTLEDDYDVVVASNGREVLEVLAEHPDTGCLVLDVMMPEMDGMEALRRIRQGEESADVGVIMLTARTGEDDHMNAFGFGADAYLTKPFDPDELLATIATTLGRTPEERAAVRAEERSKAALLRQLERRFG